MGKAKTADELRRDYKRDWRRKNAERVRAYQRDWDRKHPGKRQEYAARYWQKKSDEAEKAAQGSPRSEQGKEPDKT